VIAMTLPHSLKFAMIAGKNFAMRDDLMQKARGARGVQRAMFVCYARMHHRLAMQNAANARHSLKTQLHVTEQLA